MDEQVLRRSTYVGFRTALKEGDVAEMLTIAHYPPEPLSPLDALELTLLCCEKGGAYRSGQYQDFAARWIASLTMEQGLKLDQIAYAVEQF